MTKKERKTTIECFKSHYIAHRGLFDNSKDAPENSIMAFKKAVDAGYGIELDVQLSKDKCVVVAHDYDLKRICGVDKIIKDLSYKELSEYNILNSAESIPLFTDVLRVINGKVPLIVEIKAERDYEETCRFAAQILSEYKGTYCVESFSPYVVCWYKRNCPNVIRGQLADDFLHKKHFKSNMQNFILTNMIYNLVSIPDFIAYNHQYQNKKILRFWKKLLGCSLVAWTIKAQEELDAAVKLFDIIIFDNFIPK